MKPYVFLDRDGTVIVEKNYLADPDGVELLPGVPEALRRFRDAGYGLILVTNQSGVGRGYFTLDAVHAVHRRLEELLAAEGITLDAIYICPHAPDANCPCRKPNPGMIQQACQDFDIDLPNSIMIGDKESDIELGKTCGMRTRLVGAPDPGGLSSARDVR